MLKAGGRGVLEFSEMGGLPKMGGGVVVVFEMVNICNG